MKTLHQQKLGALLILLLLTLFAAPAMAGPGPQVQDDRHGEKFGRHEGHASACSLWQNPELVKKLALSDTQITELKEADFTFRKQQLELKAQRDMLHLEMEQAFSAEKPDEAAVRKLADKMADVQGKIFIENIESRLAVAKYLTADQLRKLQADSPQPHGEQPKDKHHNVALNGKEKRR